MYLDLTPAQRSLQVELREYFTFLMDPATVASLDAEGPDTLHTRKRIFRQLGADGWLGVGWPTDWGGQGRTAVDQYLFYDEATRAGVPIPMIALNTVGPTLMEFGTPEQQKFFLPKILAGEIDFAIGYTEAESGTDLFSLKTRAVLNGDHYLVNGAKVYTSGGDAADFIWLAARSHPDSSLRHLGISLLIVDTADPGFSSTPIYTVGGFRTTATYYENVVVPVTMRGGEENEGVRIIGAQLAHERIAMSARRASSGLAERFYGYAARATTTDGTPLLEVAWVRPLLGRIHMLLQAAWTMNLRCAWLVDQGSLGRADAAAAKVFGTETMIEVCRLMLEVLGPAGVLRRGSEDAALHGEIEVAYRDALTGTFGGGGNEIQREIIATAGLGVPRVPR